MPSIGILHSGSQANFQKQIDMFTLSLERAGYVDQQNGFTINDMRFADDIPDLMGTHADYFVQQRVNVLLAAGGSLVAAKATAATVGHPEIKVVFTTVADLARPAQNMTGICARTIPLDPMRLSLLHELLPVETTFGVLVNSSRPNFDPHYLDSTAAMLGLQPPDVRDVADPQHPGGNLGKVNQAFHSWGTQPYRGALVAASPFFNNHRQQVVDAANHNNVAAIYQWREFVMAGGVMSYGPKLMEGYKLAATYVARILQGEQPQNLPIVSLSNFELVINPSAAKNLGIVIPETLYARADDIIV